MKATRLGKERILAILSENAQAIKLFGVKDLGIFGSVARGEDTADSDVDFVVVFEPEKREFTNLINLADYLEDLLGKKVDLLTYESLRPTLRARVDKDLLHVTIGY